MQQETFVTENTKKELPVLGPITGSYKNIKNTFIRNEIYKKHKAMLCDGGQNKTE